VSAKTSMRRMFVAACALLAFAAAPQGADAGLKPQAPPQVHRTAPHPVPYPGAPPTKSSSSTSSLTTSTPALRRTARATVVVRAIHGAVAAATKQRSASHSKAQPPAANPGRPIGFQDAAGLHELRSAASSSSSALLLAAGIVLLLLVIGETTFLGLASSRLGVAGAPGPVRRRPPEEPFPIRRIQLRR
jgi:hypothetical protein